MTISAMKINGGQYEERKKQKQAKENKKQAPMDCDCCYRNSCGNFCGLWDTKKMDVCFPVF